MIGTAAIQRHEASVDTLHDMRNLFAATAAAASLVEDASSVERRAKIADSLRDAARRGQAQCDRLMGRPVTTALVRRGLPVDASIKDTVPLFRLALGPQISIQTDLRAPGVATALDEEEIEIVLLELATNVRRHAAGATRMLIRSRVAGDRLWLVVANDGSPARTLCRVGGRGLARIRRMLRAIDARLHPRCTRSGGLVLGVTAPIVVRGGTAPAACKASCGPP